MTEQDENRGNGAAAAAKPAGYAAEQARAATVRAATVRAATVRKLRPRKRIRSCLGCGTPFKSEGIHNRQCADCAVRVDWPATMTVWWPRTREPEE
jgi:hypothetical protein